MLSALIFLHRFDICGLGDRASKPVIVIPKFFYGACGERNQADRETAENWHLNCCLFTIRESGQSNLTRGYFVTGTNPPREEMTNTGYQLDCRHLKIMHKIAHFLFTCKLHMSVANIIAALLTYPHYDYEGCTADLAGTTRQYW